MLGSLFGVIALPALTATLLHLETRLELSAVLLLFLTVTVIATAVGGGLVGIPVGVGAVSLANYYFTEPLRTLLIHDREIVVAIVTLAVVTASVSWLVHRAESRAGEARRASAEASALVSLASTLTSTQDPMPALVDDLVRVFGLDGVSLLRRSGGGWVVDACAGDDAPRSPHEAADALHVSDGYILALSGRSTPADDRRVLTSYAAQLAVALTAEQLQEEAARAQLEADRNRLRAALLSSVSHDLRTPLSAIKASASSLLQSDVRWDRPQIAEFARSIVDEADRLNRLIANLLDMSRLETDSVALRSQPVGLEDVVPAALSGLAFRDAPIALRLDPDSPAVAADPVLLERVVVNLVDNALRWSPPGAWVTIVSSDAGVSDRLELRIVDHGPGIPVAAHERIFRPFQRLGDAHRDGAGVGLGLAVARGFARAMGGDIVVRATPGGGTTMAVVLPIASVDARPDPWEVPA